MQSSVVKRSGLNLSRGAAVVVLAGLAAGCSSQVARFGGTGIDSVFTASTNQRQIIGPKDQPYPGDTPPVQAAPAPAVSSGSVTRSALAPAAGAPVRQETVQPAPQQVASLQSPQPSRPALDDMSTGTVQPKPSASHQGDAEPQGWSRVGGTQVTVKAGETVYNLSRRFGVPAKSIMQANGLSEAEGLKAGQQIVIPTYVYSSKAPVSAPDNDPKVAAAKSSSGQKDPAAPKAADSQTVAMLPNAPKLKDGKAIESANTAAANAGVYTVQQGDTLTGIARKTGTTTAALKQANGLGDGLIRVGQKLKIPGAAGAATTVAAAAPKKTDPVTTGSTPPKPAKAAEVASYTPPKPAKPASKVIEEAEQSDAAAPDATGIGRMRWPVRGRVIANYGRSGGKSSDGIDIAVPEGTPVKAAENGVVIYAGDGLKEFGNTVLVRHEDGLVTVYGHASELKVSRGDKVKRGQDIAVSGMSGTTDAPKLHFEVRKNSAPVDPKTYLE